MSQVFQSENMGQQRNGEDVENELVELVGPLFDETGDAGLETAKAASEGESWEVEFKQIQELIDELDQSFQGREALTSDQNEAANSSSPLEDNASDENETMGDPQATVVELPDESQSNSDVDNDIEILKILPVNGMTSFIRSTLSSNAGVPDESTDDSEPEIIEIPVEMKTPTSLKRRLSSDDDDDDVKEVYQGRGAGTKEVTETEKRQNPQKKVRIPVDVSNSDEDVDVDVVSVTRRRTRTTKSSAAGKPVRRSPMFQKSPPKPSAKLGDTKTGRKPTRKSARRCPSFIRHG